MKAGEVLLFENLRFYKEETKGDEAFAEKLAALADVYMNDAFGTAHRAHASTAIIAKFFPNDKMFGYIMGNELASINKVINEGEKPITAILGGAKVSGKIEIINNLLDKVDHILIGGGMMFTFIKALGGKVGNSLVEDDLIETAKKAMAKAHELGVIYDIPTDTVIADKFDNNANRNSASRMKYLMAGWDWISDPKPGRLLMTSFENSSPFYGTGRWVFLRWIILLPEHKLLRCNCRCHCKRGIFTHWRRRFGSSHQQIRAD